MVQVMWSHHQVKYLHPPMSEMVPSHNPLSDHWLQVHFEALGSSTTIVDGSLHAVAVLETPEISRLGSSSSFMSAYWDLVLTRKGLEASSTDAQFSAYTVVNLESSPTSKAGFFPGFWEWVSTTFGFYSLQFCVAVGLLCEGLCSTSGWGICWLCLVRR